MNKCVYRDGDDWVGGCEERVRVDQRDRVVWEWPDLHAVREVSVGMHRCTANDKEMKRKSPICSHHVSCGML